MSSCKTLKDYHECLSAEIWNSAHARIKLTAKNVSESKVWNKIQFHECHLRSRSFIPITKKFFFRLVSQDWFLEDSVELFTDSAPSSPCLGSATTHKLLYYIASQFKFFSSSTSTVINISFCFRFREERDESFFTYLHNDDIYSDYAFIAALLTLMSYRICLFFRHNANFFFLSLFYQRLANSQRTVQISSSQALKMSTKLCLNVSASLSRERKSDSATKTVKDPRMIHFSGIICRIRDRWCWWTIFCLCWC